MTFPQGMGNLGAMGAASVNERHCSEALRYSGYLLFGVTACCVLREFLSGTLHLPVTRNFVQYRFLSRSCGGKIKLRNFTAGLISG